MAKETAIHLNVIGGLSIPLNPYHCVLMVGERVVFLWKLVWSLLDALHSREKVFYGLRILKMREDIFCYFALIMFVSCLWLRPCSCLKSLLDKTANVGT